MEKAMIKQWQDIKKKHPDSILLFRCGDFYETIGTDAVECGKILGITPTKHADRTVTADFPHHALDTYLPKLIRAGKRVAICDQLEDPKLRKAVKRGISETSNSNDEQKNEETMKQNVQAADLIGKEIVNADGTMKYVVKSVDGDKLATEFIIGENKPVAMPMPMAQVEKLLAGGWTIGGAAATTTATDDVEEVEDVQPKPAKTVTMEKPKTAKPKAEKPKAEPKGKGGLNYETYTNKKSKVCARITGFGEDDAAYQRENAELLHASASYLKDKKGNRVNYLCFGPRYAAAAKDVCDALNQGKTLADCQAIIDAATQERIQKREEWKAKKNEQTYSDEDVAAIIEQALKGGELPENIKKHIKAA